MCIRDRLQATPVAPGAEIVTYSGFSADNYLTQPYNNDLDFGTGDFTIMFWQKSITHSDQEVFFNIGDHRSGYNRFVFYRPNNSSKLSLWRRGSSSTITSVDTVVDVLNENTYNFIVGSRKDGVFTFYVNGKNVGSFDRSDDFTFHGLNRTCIVGIDYDGTDPVQSMSLFRISKTAPTDEQIKRIYNCLLYTSPSPRDS